MPEHSHATIRELRDRVEHMLCEGAEGREVIRLLERLVTTADDGTEPCLFAHRQLAELRLELNPWQAALHLRRVMQGGAGDDGVHALMGLCQALLGNFRSAVSSYRKALSLAPDNPWYRHNLGHLLDVGVGDSEAALQHLRAAERIETEEDEITASLAHCLARLGELHEAGSLARRALDMAPDKVEHKRLNDWVEKGAPGAQPGRTAKPLDSGFPAAPRSGRSMRFRAINVDAVADLLTDHMTRAGFAPGRIARAQALWGDFQDVRSPGTCKPQVLAAAVEYALSKLESGNGVTQAKVARRYGVAKGSVSQRYGEIRSLLALVPSDPRYS